MLNRLDEWNVGEGEGREELARILSAAEADGFQVDLKGRRGHIDRIVIRGTIRKKPTAERGSKNP